MNARQASLVHAKRRTRLADALGPHALAIQPTALERLRNGDNAYDYRFDSSFFYLTSFTEAESWLFIETDAPCKPTVTLVLRPKDEQREIWDGYRLGPEAAPATLGVNAAFAIDELDTVAKRPIAGKRCIWFPFHAKDNKYEGLPARVHAWVDAVRANGVPVCASEIEALMADRSR